MLPTWENNKGAWKKKKQNNEDKRQRTLQSLTQIGGGINLTKATEWSVFPENDSAKLSEKQTSLSRSTWSVRKTQRRNENSADAAI